MRELSIEVKQLAQLKMFEPALSALCKICPKVRILSLRSAGLNNQNEVNKEYRPIDIIKVGFENIERLRLARVPLNDMDFKGFIGRHHSYTPSLLHLDIQDGFDEVLMDLRDFMT